MKKMVHGEFMHIAHHCRAHMEMQLRFELRQFYSSATEFLPMGYFLLQASQVTISTCLYKGNSQNTLLNSSAMPHYSKFLRDTRLVA